MPGYYLFLAVRSLRREIAFTALMVLCIGIGIAATMTTLTVLHVLDSDPLPGKSATLFVPRLDPLPLDYHQTPGAPDPADSLTFPDATAIVAARVGVHQAMMSGASATVRGSSPSSRPFNASGRMTTADFFTLFDVGFAQGRAWSSNDDARASRVVVLGRRLARVLTGTEDAVGRQVQLDEHEYQVIGVVDDFHPSPLFYGDASAQAFSSVDEFFVPISTAMAAKINVSGSVSSWGADATPEQMLTSATASWLQVWVQLDSPAMQGTFRRYIENYAAQQHAAGRFQRPASASSVLGMMDYLHRMNLIPADVRLQFWVSAGFLLVCLANVIGLLLAKFLRRSGEISVRRAMGATRAGIFWQFGFEAALLGVLGGLVGLAGSAGGLWLVRQRPDDYARLAHMDITMLATTLVVAVAAALMAGLLPAWRACNVAPALQMKAL